MRRDPGTGNIEQLPSGRWRVRLSVDGKLRTFRGTYATDAEALAVLDALRDKFAKGAARAVTGATLGSYGEAWIDAQELAGRISANDVRNVWRKHVVPSPLGQMAVASVKRAHVSAWARGLLKTLALRTVRVYLGYVKGALDEATSDGLVEFNPAARLRVKGQAATSWTHLDRDELPALLRCEAIPREDRLLIAILAGTGLRASEFVQLRLEDLVVEDPEPRVLVRRGGRVEGRTKTGRHRAVPLLGDALGAARQWLEMLPTYAPANPKKLAFPRRDGGRRERQRPFGQKRAQGKKREQRNNWRTYLDLAGIKRRVRLHDLRHTCASWLVAGWWGRVWRLEDVRDFLGHSAIAMTEKYAHLAPSRLADAARDTNSTSMPRRELPSERNALNSQQIAQAMGYGGPHSEMERAPASDSAGLGPNLASPWHGIAARVEASLRGIAGRDAAGVTAGREALMEGLALMVAADPALSAIRDAFAADGGPFFASRLVDALVALRSVSEAAGQGAERAGGTP